MSASASRMLPQVTPDALPRLQTWTEKRIAFFDSMVKDYFTRSQTSQKITKPSSLIDKDPISSESSGKRKRDGDIDGERKKASHTKKDEQGWL